MRHPASTSSEAAAITAALREADLPEACSTKNLSGGCIHSVRLLEFADTTRVVAKVNASRYRTVFESEMLSLRVLAETCTVYVPQPILVTEAQGVAVLLMTAIERGRAANDAWQRFGRDLAALHAVDVGTQFGFECDNHLGSTPQPNPFCDDWVEFNTMHRLGHQRRLIHDAGSMSGRELGQIDRIIDALPRLLPRSPKPALLHGDLWSGNALPSTDGRIAVIDPACSIGDRWADIAMMQLFGGFPDECFAAYCEQVDDHENLEARIGVYQLYHVLNHVTIFGRGYVAQVLQLADRLLQFT